jgi:hypothetical protein
MRLNRTQKVLITFALLIGNSLFSILSVGGAESMMLSACAESIILSALAMRVLRASYSQCHPMRV